MKLMQDHSCLCGRNTVDLLDPTFSELVSFYLGFKTESNLFSSVLSTSDSQQLTSCCYYDTSKYEGQHNSCFLQHRLLSIKTEPSEN
jgi:hypothetical protein